LNLHSEQNSLREYVRQAARLREYAANATTARVKARLLEEAANQERLAEEIKEGRGVTALSRASEGRPPYKAYRRDYHERRQRIWTGEALVQIR
jgi:hypothetical protein